MRRFFRFWWLCAQRAFWGNTAFANDWQWLIGYPAIVGLVLLLGYFGLAGTVEVTLTTGAVGVFAAAFLAFLITWLAGFIMRLLNAPVELFHEPSARALSGRPAALPLIEYGMLRGGKERRTWWAEITAALNARNVTICLGLEECRGGMGPITWNEPQRLILGTRDMIARGETFKIPLVDEFEREDGSKFIGWCASWQCSRPRGTPSAPASL
jgi:hypothetical protein